MRALTIALLCGGLGLLTVGIAGVSTSRPSGFGWTAYTPLSRTAYAPGQPVVQWLFVVAIVLGACLLVAAGAVLLRRVGRRRRW